ncbi:ATP-binding cassette domain-containing protein [Peribacillus muralis]|uniref:ATP-binding cassette domain-containing protein n=1 Tax=Peribacillus muralis TaxID=264697 RepID=UPI001F4EBC9A|nr:ATP-binding cassette domain-containing protein [Peribacillus muralis]MCK1995411.1 ATP-binding cassette domain-containing protein [Peribacillus muralis]MCK2015994.1 ATP-binding cassette domain-containing protein [Peribacillus muralis]
MKDGNSFELQEVAKSFGEHDVLKGVDLSFKKGEFVAVVGKSGCGKSTLLRLVAGLDKPTGGKIFVNGKPLNGLNKSSRTMFQDGRLFPWKKILQNVGVGLNGNWKHEAMELLEQVGLADRAHEWPSVLSGGQKQRVALARALVNQPDILLLDEPLGALDALTRVEMQRLIEELWRKRDFTALLVTHDVEEAVTLADRVLLIEEGKVVMNKEINLPRPRQKDHLQFVSITSQILHRVMQVDVVRENMAIHG